MKKIYYILLCTLVTLSCNNTEKETSTDKNIPICTVQVSKPEVKPINENEFKTLVFDFEKNPQTWVFKGEKPCIVDCYADWCRPCKMIAPFFDTLAIEYEGKVNFYKINVDKAQALSYFFQIKSIPTVFFCQKGDFQYAVGANSIDYYRKAIDSLLLGK